MSNIVKHEGNAPSIFSNLENFEYAQRVAKMLATSDLVPAEYKGNVANTLVALDISSRVNVPPLMVMQNLHIIEGRPSWSSTFIISAINTCGRFTALRFVINRLGNKDISYEYWEGPKENRQRKQKTITVEEMTCYAICREKDGNELVGPKVSISMAIAEGWYTKKGSKWQTMPEMMLQYRAAAFFGRLYTPDILMGMPTFEEVTDVHTIDIEAEELKPNANNIAGKIGSINEAGKHKEKADEPKPQTPESTTEPSLSVLPNDSDEGSWL